MGKIKHYIDEARNLSTFEASGQLSAADYIGAIENQYSQHPTANSLWIFTRVDVSGISTQDFTDIAMAAKKYATQRGQARTIVVAGDGMEAIIVKLYSAISEALGSPITYEVVSTKDEADLLLRA